MGSSPSKASQRPATTPNVGNKTVTSNGTVNSSAPRVSKSATHSKTPPVESRTPPVEGKTPPEESQTPPVDKTREAGKPKLPPAVPPKSRKADVFDVSKYQHVDEYVLTAPAGLLMGTFKELVSYLTDNSDWTEMETVRGLFRWVTSIDVYSLHTEAEPPEHSPLEYFLKIKNNNGNHAHLLSGICQMAGIKCVIISGMNKSAAYEVGGKADRRTMGAQWNAVHVNGDWRFIDAFWSSACVVGKKSSEWTLIDTDGNITQENDEDDTSEGETQHRVNEFYFMPDPDQFVWTHFPDEAQWQLMKKPITLKDFEQHVYTRERFYYLGMSMTKESEQTCLLETREGQAQLSFGLPFRESEHFRYKYMLYQSRSLTGQSDVSLDRFVLYEHTADILRFALRFPITGKFKMDIYGLDLRESDIFDLCCTYVINCNEAQKNCIPLPDCPEIGWGPGAEAKNAGLAAKSHDGAIIKTDDGRVVITLGSHKDVQLHQLLKNTIVDEATLSKYALVREENGEFFVEVRLPQSGEYAIKLYCNDEGEDGEAENVLNYLLQCDNPNVANKPFPNLIDGRLGKKTWADVLGVKPASHLNGKFEAKDGKLKLNFVAKNNLDLLCEVHSVDPEAMKHMKVIVREVNGKWTFDCDLPIKGEYSVNVFAREKGGGPRIYNVHTYLGNSDGHPLSEEEKDDVTKSTSSVLEATVNVLTETVQTADKEALIPIPNGYEEVVASFQRRHANDPPDDEAIAVIKLEGKKYFKTKLDEYGEYMFDVYSKEGKIVKNIAKYQINRKPASELYEDDTKMLMENLGMAQDDTQSTVEVDDEEKVRKAAKAKIQKGMNLKDLDTLEKGMAAYEATNPPDIDKDPFIQKAKKLLEILRAKEALNVAAQKRDCAMLDAAIAQAKGANYDNLLDLQIAMASRLRDQLHRIEKLRHSVLSMDQKTVAEIRTYGNPPEGVHQSLMATFLLLGHSKKEVRVWKTCQALLGRTGKESVMRKISQFEPTNCFLETATNAKKAMEDFSLEMIRDVSAGAATFYVWSKGMIEVVESNGGAQAKDPMTTGAGKKDSKSVNKKRETKKAPREKTKESLKKPNKKTR